MENKNVKGGSSEEKLSDEEFKKLIPHLELNQQFLIEILKDGKWIHLFNFDKDKGVYCNVCERLVLLKSFKWHIGTWRNHKINFLFKIKQFYHPLYTSNHGREDLSIAEIEKKTHEANAIANLIELEEIDRDTGESSGKIRMSIEDLLNIEFQETKKGKWQKMLSSEGPIKEKGKYKCHICSKYCDGIITVNNHLRGNSHRFMQDDIHCLRLSKNDRVTKFSEICVDLKNNVHQNNFGVTKNLKVLDKRTKREKKVNTLHKNSSETEGLIGVEYVAVLRDEFNNGECKYACCLCNFLIIPTEELMENHLVSVKHRQNYCEMHFSDTTKRFDRMVKATKLQFSTGKAFVLSKMARGIEDYHGYGKPHVTTLEEFLRNKEKIGDEVAGLPHACQEFGPSFSNVVTAQDLYILSKNGPKSNFSRKMNKPRFMVQPRGKFYLNMPVHKSRPVKKKVDGSIGDRNSRSLSAYRTKSHSNSRSISPHSRKRKISTVRGENIGDSSDVWSTYRNLISKAAAELEGDYLDYRRHPEKHPNYDKEWSVFWKRRKAELQDEGIDYRSYDFQPGWTTYFRQRLEELFGEDLQKSKIHVRRQLNIPLEAEEDSQLPYSERAIEPPYKIKSISRDNRRHAKNISWNSKGASSPRESHVWNPPLQIENEKPNVIHMLRLMTALEEHLGSLGGKILDLLTEAISLEKLYADDLEQLEQRILNSNNCKLLKAAQEKLKSQLYADLVEEKKINSFKKVIECSEFLLNRADEMGWSTAIVEEPNTSSANIQFEKLFEVLQDKSKNEFSGSKNKSLPDTLMELMTQKKDAIRGSTFDKALNPNQNHAPQMSNFGNNRNNLAYPTADLTQQNTSSFLQQSSFPSNNLGSNFNSSRPNYNFHNTPQYQGVNSNIWNRLDRNSNLLQQNQQQNLNGQFMGSTRAGGMGPNRSAPNTYGPNGSFGSGYNNSFNYLN